jgi:hypothetical protein
MMGTKQLGTPLRYHTGYRHFLTVQTGRIMVKMTPWKSAKYLYPIQDFENYEFWSPVNVWNPQPKYLHEMDKLRFIEFDVTAGHVLYIPPYWFYSIQYLEEDTLVCGFTYHTPMNCLANLPNLTRYYLQQANIEKKESNSAAKRITLSSIHVQENQNVTEDTTEGCMENRNV